MPTITCAILDEKARPLGSVNVEGTVPPANIMYGTQLFVRVIGTTYMRSRYTMAQAVTLPVDNMFDGGNEDPVLTPRPPPQLV